MALNKCLRRGLNYRPTLKREESLLCHKCWDKGSVFDVNSKRPAHRVNSKKYFQASLPQKLRHAKKTTFNYIYYNKGMKLIQQNISKQYYCLVDVFYAKWAKLQP